MNPDDYCANGCHYIGDAEECWRCQLWEQQKAKGRIYRAVDVAHALRDALTR